MPPGKVSDDVRSGIERASRHACGSASTYPVEPDRMRAAAQPSALGRVRSVGRGVRRGGGPPPPFGHIADSASAISAAAASAMRSVRRMRANAPPYIRRALRTRASDPV